MITYLIGKNRCIWLYQKKSIIFLRQIKLKLFYGPLVPPFDSRPVTDVTVATLRLNNALWLVKNPHMTWNIQSECKVV